MFIGNYLVTYKAKITESEIFLTLSNVKMSVEAEVLDGFAQSIATKYPTLGSKRVAYAIDGLKLAIESSPYYKIQNRFGLMTITSPMYTSSSLMGQ